MGILDGFMNFDDPQSMSMLGLAAGIANAARPSRMPVPLGAAMAEGFQNALQFRGEAQRQQLLQQEVQQRNLANAMALWQLQFKKSLFDQAGFPSPALPTGASPQIGQAAPPISGGIPTAPSALMTAQQAQPAPSGGGILSGNASEPSQNLLPGLSPELMRGGIIAHEMGLDKLYAQQNPGPTDAERMLRAINDPNTTSQNRAFLTEAYKNMVNDPTYKGQIASQEAWAKLAPAIKEKQAAADIEAAHAITPTDITTPDGPQSLPLTQTQRLAIANGKIPNVQFAPNATPLNAQALTDQQKTVLDPTRKAYQDNEQTKATITAMMELGKGLTTGNLTPHITAITNAMQNAGLSNLIPGKFDPGTAAALHKTISQLVLNRIQTAQAEGSGASRGNRLLFQVIQDTKPTLETPGPALQAIGQNMIDTINIDQEHNKAVLNDANAARMKAQPLPQNWESDYWQNYAMKNPGWEQKQAQKLASAFNPVSANPQAKQIDEGALTSFGKNSDVAREITQQFHAGKLSYAEAEAKLRALLPSQ